MTALADFPTPISLGGGRTWTATFESFNPRKDDAYWWVTIREPGKPDLEFFAQVDVLWGTEGDRAREDFEGRIHDVAKTGRTNTGYRGSTMWQLKRKRLNKS